MDPSSASDQLNEDSDEPRIHSSRPKKHSDKSKHKSRSRYVSSSSEEDQSPVARHRSSKPSRAQPSGAASDQDLPQHDPDPPYYREVALSDITPQYSEEVDTFRRILYLPDPRDSMPRSSTSVLGLDDEKGRQELRPRGPSSILPLSSVIKDAFDKFQHDFKAANLAEGKYVKPPPSTSKWYKVGQPTFQDKIQELNTDFAKICITPRPPGARVAKVPLPVLKKLEHQARQNISTLNFTAAFAKTSSSCNASLEKCQHSIKSTVKKIKSQIQKGANPEKAAKRGYEEVAEYMEFWNKTVLIQHRALTCLSKSLAHILQRELYSMANTGLLRREAEMTLLHTQLGETRRQEVRNSSFWDSSLFKSQLVKEGEDFLLKKGTSKDSQGFVPYQNKPFRGPHKKRGSYRKRPYGGNSSQNSNQSFPSGRGKPNFRGPRGRFRPHNRGRGRGNPLPNDSSKASLSPPVGGRLRSFRRDWLTNKCSQNVLNIITNGYVLPFRSKPNLVRFPLIMSEYKAQQKDQALAICIQSHLSKNAIERVESEKSLRFYSRLFLVPKPHQSWRPVIDLSRLNTFLHVEKFKIETPESIRTSVIPGEWVSLIDLSDTYLHIPIHPNSRKYLRFCYKAQVFQFTFLPFALATAPQVFTMIVKEVKLMALSRGLRIHQYLDDWLIRSQSQGGSPSEHTGGGRPNSVLGVDNKSGKVRAETYSGVFVRGLRIPPRFSPCKTHSREMAQTSGFDPTTQVKTCFDCKMFDVSNWVASLNGENGPGGTPSHEALSVSSQGALEIFSVAGQPPSLDRSHCSPPTLVAKSLKRDERCRPSSQRPQYPTLYRRLKRRLGRSLKPKFYKGSVVRSGKKATHKCPRIEGGLPGPSRLQGPVPESNSVSCYRQLNSGSLHQQTRRNTLSRDVRSPVEDHDLVPSLPHNIESQAHSRVPECDGRPTVQVQPSAVNRMVSAPTGVQTDLPEVVHTSCRLICHSLEPQAPTVRVSYPRPKGLGHRCSKHKLDQPHGLCLPSYGSPSQGDPKDQAMSFGFYKLQAYHVGLRRVPPCLPAVYSRGVGF